MALDGFFLGDLKKEIWVGLILLELLYAPEESEN